MEEKNWYVEEYSPMAGRWYPIAYCGQTREAAERESALLNRTNRGSEYRIAQH